jgi:hypothetical protein
MVFLHFQLRRVVMVIYLLYRVKMYIVPMTDVGSKIKYSIT